MINQKHFVWAIEIQGTSHTDELTVTDATTGICLTNPEILINTISQNPQKGKMCSAFIIVLVALSVYSQFCLVIGESWILCLQFSKYDD